MGEAFQRSRLPRPGIRVAFPDGGGPMLEARRENMRAITEIACSLLQPIRYCPSFGHKRESSLPSSPVLGRGSAPLLAVATGPATPLPAMLGRGDLLAVGGAIRTALGVVRIGLRCGAGKLLGLAAREPRAEPQAPPQPFARLPGEPHRCLPFMPAGAGNPVLQGSRQPFSAQAVIGFQR